MVAATEVPNVLMIAGGLTPIILGMFHRKQKHLPKKPIFPIRKHGRDDPTPAEVLEGVFPTDKRYGSKQKDKAVKTNIKIP